METIETYNGWTNRETWAVSLHLNNDEGLYYDLARILEEAFLEDVDGSTREGWIRGVMSAVDSLSEWVEEILSFNYWEENGTTMPHGIHLMKDDVGSLWRVNWREIVEAELEEEIQACKEGKYLDEEEAGEHCEECDNGTDTPCEACSTKEAGE
jgi:hypothetical protein